MDKKTELTRTIRNRLVEDILLTLAEDVSDILSTGDIDSDKGDILTLLGLYGLFDLFQCGRTTRISLIGIMENMKDKAFTDSNILHAATRADLRLNKLEEYICNYVASRHSLDPIGEVHWTSNIYKLVLVLCGLYIAVADQGCWTDDVNYSYDRFATVMDYYVWRLKGEPDEEVPLHSFLAEVWPVAKTTILSARSISVEN